MIRNSERKKVIHCNLMSVFLAAAYNPRAAIVFHAPKSCSHIAHNAFWEMRLKITTNKYFNGQCDGSNLFVTGLADKEAIFGGEKLLKACLLDIAAVRKPEYIIVAAGCAAGVIGDDVEAICRETEASTGIPVLCVEGSGFMNQKAVDGVLSVTKALCQKLVYPLSGTAKNPAALAVFGINVIFSRESEIDEINRLLGLFGFKNIYYPPGGMTLKQLQETAAVSAVTAMGFIPKNLEAVRVFARQFAETMQISYINLGIPSSLEATYEWLLDLGTALGRKQEAIKAVEKERLAYSDFLQNITALLQGKSYILAISLPQRYFEPLPIIKMLEEAGLKLQGIIFCDELTTAEQLMHKKLLGKNLKTNYYDETKLQNTFVDLVITTAPKKCSRPQYCIGFRRVGRKGSENFLLKLAETLTEQRELVYENR